LREIAQVTGLSPTTVRDVRERMRRGDDVVPNGAKRRLRSATAGTADAPTAAGPSTSEHRLRSVPGGADRRMTSSRADLLDNLSKDPSLRFSDAGRSLLRALFTRSGGPPDAGLVQSLPPHIAFGLSTLAQACAQEWLCFAEQVEGHLRLYGEEKAG